MSYISSSDIQIFPATRRTVNSASGKQLTEANLISLVGKLLDKNGFVITKDISSWSPDSTTDLFEFVIHGYYVAVKYNALTSLLNNDGVLYAIITLDTVANNPWFDEIDGQDGNSVYSGVNFDVNIPEDLSNTYYLAILEKSNNSYTIPSESLIKFDIASINLPKIIDAGDLNS